MEYIGKIVVSFYPEQQLSCFRSLCDGKGGSHMFDNYHLTHINMPAVFIANG